MASLVPAETLCVPRAGDRRYPQRGEKWLDAFHILALTTVPLTCMSLWRGCLTVFQSWKNISSCVSPEAQVKKKTCEALVDFRAVYSSHFLVVAKTLAQKWKERVRNVVQKAPGFQGADSSYFISPSLQLQEMSLKFRDFLQSKRKQNQTKQFTQVFKSCFIEVM